MIRLVAFLMIATAFMAAMLLSHCRDWCYRKCHACELATAGFDPSVLRTDAARYGAPLRDAGRLMFSQWLKELRP